MVDEELYTIIYGVTQMCAPRVARGYAGSVPLVDYSSPALLTCS